MCAYQLLHLSSRLTDRFGCADWDENGDDDYAESEEEAEPAVLSKHQQRQAKIAQAVSQLEEEAIGPKSWDMKGEVRALDRPENSLLGVTVDVER